MKFEFTAPIVSETKEKQKFIRGTLVSEGLSRNKNYYTFESLRSIAQTSVGKLLYFGVDPKSHRHIEKEPIGRITATWFSKRLRRVFFKALITDKQIAETVQTGWGVSIKGLVRKGKYLLDSFGKMILKIGDLLIQSVQLIDPTVKTGVSSAKVEQIVEETMSFTSPRNRLLTLSEIIAIAESVD